MPELAVKIRMVITKTYVVEADDEDAAIEWAYAISTAQHEDGIEEDFSEDVVDVQRLTNGGKDAEV